MLKSTIPPKSIVPPKKQTGKLGPAIELELGPAPAQTIELLF